MISSNPLIFPCLQRLLLSDKEELELLEAIDTLQSRGIGNSFSPPQLVISGDQSSGTSSVLEVISGITFATDKCSCTRFPTEFILRKGPKYTVTASIVPDPNFDRTTKENDLLKNFKHEITTQDGFNEVFDKAGQAMGGKSFSKDVLTLEICGPL